MNIDPRTPVLVGVGQVTEHVTAGANVDDAPTPLELMTRALQFAERDAGASTPLLSGLDELIAVGSFTWHPGDAAALVAETLGLSPRATVVTSTGGNVPQRLINAHARRIARGEEDCVVVVGAEAMHAHARARRDGRDLHWPTNEPGPTTRASDDVDRVPFTDEEYAHGLRLPVQVYPLFENARRFARGWTLEEHRDRLAQLWHHFAEVAAANPYAWLRDAPSATTITTPSPTNRMVAFPYTKLLVANLPVDMGAAFIMTSFDYARAKGVALDRMIFPHAGAEANDHWFVSERPQLDDSPAMRAIWSALQRGGADVESIAHLDLYSCFPTVVECAATILGIDALDPARVPTVTGGLTFFGGPGNNYVTHSVATMVERLRDDPQSRGLVSALGWFSTKHAWGTYGGVPAQGGFSYHDVQDEVDVQPRCASTVDNGEVVVESYTVTHERDGSPERLVVAARDHHARRIWAHSEDLELARDAETHEFIGRRGRVQDGFFYP